MGWKTALDQKVEAYLPELTWLRDEPLARHCSFRIGGGAARMALPKTAEELIVLDGFARALGVRTVIIGNGTNLLFPDEGLDALVIATPEMKAVRCEGDMLQADAGVSLARLATQAWQAGLTGLEFAHGIPGSLGGGVVMNAGAYDGTLADVLTEVTALFPDGVRTLRREELQLSYRHSIFTEQSDAVVLRAALVLKRGDRDAIRARMDELMARRKASQPLEYPSAGSTFKRPPGRFAGRLIEDCGLKGAHVGDAEVSTKHAGFVINRGGATCADVLALLEHIQNTVFNATGVTLEPEVRIIRRR
ncbi:MAG: UDP-N-acetylmuramate dehydrogenase [Oscillospiraceae bacterium]|nr:UDP-N-acetylmuramate dehydrogenase [Oscillospiraceae bacterium]